MPLLLRTCNPDMTSYNGFKWPESGPVKCPDWNPEPICGGGLHGLRDGCGSAVYLSTDEDAKWLVCEYDEADEVDLGDKVKVKRCEVVFCGDRDGALAYLDAHGCKDKPVVYAVRKAGNWGRAVAGDWGRAEAGVEGRAVAGDWGRAEAGDWGRAEAGYRGRAVAGDGGTLQISYFDGRRRIATAYVGENGIKPGVAYKLDENHQFVEAE